MKKRTVAERFWSRIDRYRSSIAWNGSRCYEWTGYRLPNDGYGQMDVAGKTINIQRIAWELTNGSIPIGMHVLHHCDNRCCGNVDHLFLGTSKDNVADKVAKNRQVRGERLPQSKLTEADVIAIRQSTDCLADLAKRYGVTKPCISKVRNQYNWRHVR